MFNLNRILVYLATAVVMVTSACSGTSTSSAPSSTESVPGDFPSVTFTTPLESRQRLLTLDIFATCAKPTASEDNEVSTVSCFFAEGGSDWRTADRQVLVVVARQDMGIDCYRAISPAMAKDYKVVTDYNRFVAVGLMNVARPYLGPDTDNPSFMWPEEVWPEDVARVLGGEVVSAGEWCPTAFD